MLACSNEPSFNLSLIQKIFMCIQHVLEHEPELELHLNDYLFLIFFEKNSFSSQNKQFALNLKYNAQIG